MEITTECVNIQIMHCKYTKHDLSNSTELRWRHLMMADFINHREVSFILSRVQSPNRYNLRNPTNPLTFHVHGSVELKVGNICNCLPLRPALFCNTGYHSSLLLLSSHIHSLLPRWGLLRSPRTGDTDGISRRTPPSSSHSHLHRLTKRVPWAWVNSMLEGQESLWSI